MFDGIGRSLDADSGRRRVASAGLTAVLIGTSMAGFWLGIAVFAATAVTTAEPEDAPMVLLEDPPEALLDKEEVPRLPAAPAAPAGESDAPAVTETETVNPLADDPKPQVVDPAPPMGTGDDPTGIGPSRCVGECGTTGTSERDGDGPMVAVHITELSWKRKIDPVYPRSARAMNLGRVSCRVRVSIDRYGTPVAAVVEHCPKVFHDASRDAMLRSRWYPLKRNGEKMAASFVVVIHFEMR